MRRKVLKTKEMAALAVAIVALIVFGGMTTMAVLSPGTPSNYQGPNWYVYRIGILPSSGGSHTASRPYWTYVNDTGVIGLTSPYHPSDCEFSVHISPIFVSPNKQGSVEQIYQMVQRATEAISKSTGSQISVPAGDVAPEHTYLLKVKYFNSSSETKVLAMYEFPCEAVLWAYATAGGYNEQNKYDIWLRIDLNDMYQNWYWEYNGTPAREVYFAIGQILATVEVNGVYSSYYVNPQSGQALFMYFGPGKEISSTDYENALKNAFQYSGGELNPAMFSRAVYVHIVLDHFGTHYANFWHTAWQGDGVLIILKFHVFVFGEWVVQNVGNPQKNGAPLKPPSPRGGFDLGWAISDWINGLNPLQKFALIATGILAVIVAIIVILAVFTPLGDLLFSMLLIKLSERRGKK